MLNCYGKATECQSQRRVDTFSAMCLLFSAVPAHDPQPLPWVNMDRSSQGHFYLGTISGYLTGKRQHRGWSSWLGFSRLFPQWESTNAFNIIFALLAGQDPALTTVPADALAFSIWVKGKRFWKLTSKLRRAMYFVFFHFSLFFFPVLPARFTV